MSILPSNPTNKLEIGFHETFDDEHDLAASGHGSATPRRDRTRHSTATVALHWASVVAIVVSVAVILTRELVDQKFARNVMLDVHRQLGLAVLLFLLLRLGARLRGGLVDHTSGMPRWMQLAAAGMHWALYGTLLSITALGWALTNAHSVGLRFLGILPLPSMAPSDSDLADLLTDYHVWVSWGLLALVAMHLGAALYHHFVRRDAVLVAMLPRRPGTSD